MKLIDLLVQELPKRGGWPGMAKCAVQDADCRLCFSHHNKVTFFNPQWIGGTWLVMGRWESPFLPMASEDFNSAIVTREQYEAALAAAQQPVWNGEGLPPVGALCEYVPGKLGAGASDDNKPSNPTEVKVVAHEKYPDSENLVFVGVWMSESGGMRASVFSPLACIPIRTPAEKRRDDAVKEIILSGWSEDPAYEIYDLIASGKIPGVKLED